MGKSRSAVRGFIAVTLLFSGFMVSADECEFIRRALSALPETGGEVLVPEGIFTCDKPVVLDRDSVTLRGVGDATLVLADNSNSPLIIMGHIETPPTLVHDVRVVNLKLDGNRHHQQMECWSGPCDSGGPAAIRNNGVTIRGVHGGGLENISIVRPRSGGVVTEKNCAGLVIDGLNVTDSEFDGFAGYETYGSILSNMYLSDNMAAGISLDLRFSGNTIRDSILSHNHDVGIFMRESNANVFANLTIEDSGNHGVFVSESERAGSCPENNEFLNLTVLRSRGFGFLLNSECAGNKLSGRQMFRQNTAGCFHEPRAGRLELSDDMTCEN